MTLQHRPNSLLRTITCHLILLLHSYDPGMLLSTHLGGVLWIQPQTEPHNIVEEL